jgi:hypothetical protein
VVTTRKRQASSPSDISEVRSARSPLTAGSIAFIQLAFQRLLRASKATSNGRWATAPTICWRNRMVRRWSPSKIGSRVS